MTDLLKKNIGEWAEVSAVLNILATGRVATVRLNGSKLARTSAGVVVASMRLERGANVISYNFLREGGEYSRLEVSVDDRLVDIYSRKDVEQDNLLFIENLKNAIKDKSSRTFEVSGADDLLRKYCMGNGKSRSSLKQDLELELINVDGTISPAKGFSIKSYTGGDPTLFNPGNAARFRYRIDGAKKVLAEKLVAEQSSTKGRVINTFSTLDSNGVLTNSVSVPDAAFQRNLELLDAQMAEVMGLLILNAFAAGNKTVKQSLNRLILSDPLEFGADAEVYYTYRVKAFLRAVALGFTASKPWTGNEDAAGGMILVDPNLTCFCFLSDKAEFESYLLENSYFETPSTSKEKYGGYCTLEFDEKKGYYIDLLMQIREKNPFV